MLDAAFEAGEFVWADKLDINVVLPDVLFTEVVEGSAPDLVAAVEVVADVSPCTVAGTCPG